MSDREIRSEVLAGARCAEEVAERCGAGGHCGTCRPVVDALLAEAGVDIRPAVSAA